MTASNSSGFKRFPRLLVQGLGQVSPAPGHISQLAVPFAGSGPLPRELAQRCQPLLRLLSSSRFCLALNYSKLQ